MWIHLYIFEEIHHMSQQEYIMRLECITYCWKGDMHKVEDVCVRNLSRNVFQNDEKLTHLVVNCKYIKPLCTNNEHDIWAQWKVKEALWVWQNFPNGLDKSIKNYKHLNKSYGE